MTLQINIPFLQKAHPIYWQENWKVTNLYDHFNMTYNVKGFKYYSVYVIGDSENAI